MSTNVAIKPSWSSSPAIQAFTATASQTLFTLTQFTYVTGTSMLDVSINGVDQAGNFTETSGTSFTVGAGLVGGETVVAKLKGAGAPATAIGAMVANDFRLSLTSGTYITTSDVTGAGTLYLTPRWGGVGRIWVLAGGIWTCMQSAEVSLALSLSQPNTTLNGAIDNAVTSITVTSGAVFPASDFTIKVDSELIYCSSRSTNTLTVTRGWGGTTAASHSNGATCTMLTNHWIYAYANGSALALEAGSAWTASTPPVGEITSLNGMPVKAADTSRRAVGVIRASGTNTTADALLTRYVWNVDRQCQVKRDLYVTDGGGTYTYTGGWRHVRNSSANAVSFVCGEATFVRGYALLQAYTSSGGYNPATGIGVDSTSTNSGKMGYANAFSSTSLPQHSNYWGTVAAGYHAFNWLELGATNTTYVPSAGGLALEILA